MNMASVLIVEDDDVFRTLLTRVLKSAGHHVQNAGRAQEALEKGEQSNFDVLITDWLLQDDLDGQDIARSLQARNSAMQVMFMTGLPISELRHRLEGLAVINIYEKPIELDQIVEDLERHMTGRT
jgi:two-component system, cell cycle sensor histidine kinase and response regulator CckA